MRHSSVDIICDASLSVSSLILHVCETDSFLFSLFDVLLVLSVVAWGFGRRGGTNCWPIKFRNIGKQMDSLLCDISLNVDRHLHQYF